MVAITASVFEDSRNKSRKAGIDVHLPKPLQADELLQILAQRLGVRYLYRDGPSAGSTRPTDDDTSETDYRPSPALIQAMEAASRQGDTERLRELIEQVKQEDQQAGQILDRMARRFDYEQIVKWLDRTEATTDGPTA